MLLDFNEPDIAVRLATLSASDLDTLEFGVIGFDADTVVRVYNALESTMAGLAVASVMGQPLFTVVAQCMNNFMVAQRFEDAAREGTRLDATIDYVLTLRMRPIKVKLRLLAMPDHPLRYVLIRRAP
jgi:photoactive yellow protein